MKYALLGDLHSGYEETKKVLAHIAKQQEQLTIIGLGDLFECKIGKKKARTLTSKVSLEEAAIYKKDFCELLTFQTVIGNQEERIALVTGNSDFLNYPSVIHIEQATIMHGHQFEYTEEFDLIPPTFESRLLFFGHSHYSALYLNNERKKIEFDIPYDLSHYPQAIINVGSVIDHLEWCIYDSEKLTVTFKKAQ